MMGWQWHQLDHMQIICTSLQTNNHASTSQFLQAGCPSCRPTNSVKALKVNIQLNKWPSNKSKAKIRHLCVAALGAIRSHCWVGVLGTNVNDCRVTFISTGTYTDVRVD